MAVLINKITICGYGLIGGCMSLDFQKQRGSKTSLVTAYDRPTVLSRLKKNKTHKVSTEKNFNKAVSGSDIIILSATHTANEQMLIRLSKTKDLTNCLIIDTGAVKNPIKRVSRKLKFQTGTQFLPTHPMAGREKKGFENSSGKLFSNHAWYLEDSVKLNKTNKAKLNWMIKKLRAKPTYITAELHDELVSEISHLPQLISTLLGAQVNHKLIQLAGPGLKSMLRLSGSPYSVWAEIIDNNRKEIIKSLKLYSENMNMVIGRIKNKKSLEEVFRSASRSYKCL